jgi:hypothetical protein
MTDIIMEVPWTCDDRECPKVWHLSNYWTDDSLEGGYSLDMYADGDHESIEESDLPTDAEAEEAWDRYHAYVAETGQDPLGSVAVRETKTQTWIALLRPSILGMVLVSARQAGKGKVRAHEAPAEVAKWLCLRPSLTSRILRSEETVAEYLELIAASEAKGDCTVTRRGGSVHLTRDYEVPRSEDEMTRETKRIARGRNWK